MLQMKHDTSGGSSAYDKLHVASVGSLHLWTAKFWWQAFKLVYAKPPIYPSPMHQISPHQIGCLRPFAIREPLVNEVAWYSA